MRKEGNQMDKIVVSAQGRSLDDPVDPRFGRAAFFLLVEPDSMSYEVIDNAASRGMAQGAGIQAAETVVNSGAKVVLSGYVGPKAYQALKAAGIQIGQDVDGGSVREAVEKYKSGAVSLASGPTKPGHWA